MQEEFLQNLRLHLIDLSRRLEQDPSDDVADDVLYRLQQVASHLSRIGRSYINFGRRRTQKIGGLNPLLFCALRGLK